MPPSYCRSHASKTGLWRGNLASRLLENKQRRDECSTALIALRKTQQLGQPPGREWLSLRSPMPTMPPAQKPHALHRAGHDA